MKHRYPKGFTLIEILVVIAIIGLLSSFVMLSLQKARSNAQDAKIMVDMDQLRTAAGVHSQGSGPEDYSTIDCTTGPQEIIAICKDVNDIKAPFDIYSSMNGYCAEIQLYSGKWICVDNNLTWKQYDSDPACDVSYLACD